MLLVFMHILPNKLTPSIIATRKEVIHMAGTVTHVAGTIIPLTCKQSKQPPYLTPEYEGCLKKRTSIIQIPVTRIFCNLSFWIHVTRYYFYQCTIWWCKRYYLNIVQPLRIQGMKSIKKIEIKLILEDRQVRKRKVSSTKEKHWRHQFQCLTNHPSQRILLGK